MLWLEVRLSLPQHPFLPSWDFCEILIHNWDPAHEEQEADILSEENDAVISKKLIATTAKPARRKKQRKKAVPDHKKRKAQLGEAINNGIIYNDGNDDRQYD